MDQKEQYDKEEVASFFCIDCSDVYAGLLFFNIVRVVHPLQTSCTYWKTEPKVLVLNFPLSLMLTRGQKQCPSLSNPISASKQSQFEISSFCQFLSPIPPSFGGGREATDIFSLKHESSIFRSVIQPCKWFLHDGTG